MWFMVYRMRATKLSYSEMMGTWMTCNCTSKKHPVLQIQEWNEGQTGKQYQYILLFYDKLPDDVAEKAESLDIGFEDGV